MSDVKDVKSAMPEGSYFIPVDVSSKPLTSAERLRDVIIKAYDFLKLRLFSFSEHKHHLDLKLESDMKSGTIQLSNLTHLWREKVVGYNMYAKDYSITFDFNVGDKTRIGIICNHTYKPGPALKQTKKRPHQSSSSDDYEKSEEPVLKKALTPVQRSEKQSHNPIAEECLHNSKLAGPIRDNFRPIVERALRLRGEDTPLKVGCHLSRTADSIPHYVLRVSHYTELTLADLMAFQLYAQDTVNGSFSGIYTVRACVTTDLDWILKVAPGTAADHDVVPISLSSKS